MGKPPEISGRVIKATLNGWASAYGTDSNHFAAMLQRAGVVFEKGALLSAVDVFKAITFRSEKDEAIARQANAKAEEQEMINSERRKELMELAQIERVIWTDLLGPLRQELEQMPKSLSGLCNPADPETAQAVLEQWVELTKSNIQNKGKQ
jgi:hypothetical protein